MQSNPAPLSTPTLDVSAVISAFGGVTALTERMQGAGNALSGKTVQKWRERGTIPMDRWLELTALAELIGLGLDLRAFLKPRS